MVGKNCISFEEGRSGRVIDLRTSEIVGDFGEPSVEMEKGCGVYMEKGLARTSHSFQQSLEATVLLDHEVCLGLLTFFEG